MGGYKTSHPGMTSGGIDQTSGGCSLIKAVGEGDNNQYTQDKGRNFLRGKGAFVPPDIFLLKNCGIFYN